MILGVLACCLGILGIFTFGLLFVPLSGLFALLGLVRGLAYRSVAGACASIMGITLAAIGFVLSPSLLLVAGGLFVALLPDTGGANWEPRAARADNGPSLPDQQQKFCDITTAASVKYFGLAKDARKARDEKNGIVEKRVQEAMTALARARNADALKLFSASGFSFDQWKVTLLEVQAPNDKQVFFSVRPLCSDIVTIHLVAPPRKPLLDTLAAKQKGDTIILSGTFVGSRTEVGIQPRPPDADHFEQSVTERGSMEEPEFRAVLK